MKNKQKPQKNAQKTSCKKNKFVVFVDTKKSVEYNEAMRKPRREGAKTIFYMNPAAH